MKFYLDGDAEFPTICGTGTEDYFGGAWNFDVPGQGYTAFSTPYLGLHQVIQPDGLYDSQLRFGMYRWHVPDPIRFAAALRVTVQALGWRAGGRYLPLHDDLASTALFYLDRPTATRPPTPELDDLERNARSRTRPSGARSRSGVHADQGPGRSRARVITSVARRVPPARARARRRRSTSTSPARPRRRTSTAPMSSARSRAASSFSRHGPESSTRSVRANGVATGPAAARNAIRSSICHVPVARASSRDEPGARHRRVGVEQVLPRLADRHLVARRGQQRVPGAVDEDRRPGRGLGGGGRPQHGLLEVRPDRDELRLPARRYGGPVQPRRRLDRHPRHPLGQADAPGEAAARRRGCGPARCGGPGRRTPRRRPRGRPHGRRRPRCAPARRRRRPRRCGPPSRRAAGRGRRRGRARARPAPRGRRRSRSTGRPPARRPRAGPPGGAPRPRRTPARAPSRVSIMSGARENLAAARSRSRCSVRPSATSAAG